MDFAVPAIRRVKIKESKKIDKYLDLVKKNELSSSGFYRRYGPESENKRMQKDEQKLGFCQRVEKIVEYEGDRKVVGARGWFPKDLGKRLGELVIKGRIEAIQITWLLKSARILRRVLET